MSVLFEQAQEVLVEESSGLFPKLAIVLEEPLDVHMKRNIEYAGDKYIII